MINYKEEYKKIIIDLYGYDLLKTLPMVSNDLIDYIEHRLKVNLPKPLKDFYLLAGNFSKLNNAHNHLYPLENISIHDDHLQFMDEKQQMYFWGINLEDLSDDNPLVYQGEILDDEYEWYSEELQIFEFMKMMIYLQTAWGGYEFNGKCLNVKKVLKAIKDEWDLVITHDDLEFYKKNHMLITIISDENYCFCGCLDEKSFIDMKSTFEFTEI